MRLVLFRRHFYTALQVDIVTVCNGPTPCDLVASNDRSVFPVTETSREAERCVFDDSSRSCVWVSFAESRVMFYFPCSSTFLRLSLFSLINVWFCVFTMRYYGQGQCTCSGVNVNSSTRHSQLCLYRGRGAGLAGEKFLRWPATLRWAGRVLRVFTVSSPRVIDCSSL